jgi:hypothetical protein
MTAFYLLAILIWFSWFAYLINNMKDKINNKEDGHELSIVDYYLVAILISMVWPISLVAIGYIAYGYATGKYKLDEKP